MEPEVRFEAHERQFLLRQPRLGERVVAGLEAMGIGTLDELVAIGVEGVSQRLHAIHGWDVWGNRRRALLAAIGAAEALGVRRAITECREPGLGARYGDGRCEAVTHPAAVATAAAVANTPASFKRARSMEMASSGSLVP